MPDAKRAAVRLQHVLDEINDITAFTQGMTATDILDSYGHRRSVERAIQIISEAAKELPLEVRALEPDVPWPKIIGIGNYLRHEYFRIDAGVLDGILRRELPELKQAMLRLLMRVPE